MYATGAAGGQAQRTIARLWDITLQAIGWAGTGAAGLLRVLACYAPDSIPRQIIGGRDAGPEQDERLGLLASYSMITLTAETVSMHKLVQAVILATPDDSGTTPPRDTALEWLESALSEGPDRKVALGRLLRAFVPHAVAIAQCCTAEENPAGLARAFNAVALLYHLEGYEMDALRLQVAALDLVQRTYGDARPEIVARLDSIAAVYSDLGLQSEAASLQERALAVTEAALGPDHPDTALRLRDLAATYRAVGRAVDAATLEQRARRAGL
jgi:hypothetical protein